VHSGSRREGRGESIQEFIAFLYNFIRDGEAVVRIFDRALKTRYGVLKPEDGVTGLKKDSTQA